MPDGSGASDPRLEVWRRGLPPAEYRALETWASTFYPFQRAWLFEPKRLGISLKSRQTGQSHTTAGVGVLWGAFLGEQTTIISKTREDSQEVLDKSLRHAKALSRFGSEWATVRHSSKKEIRFKSGGRIIALPRTGGRGFSGNVFLDEFAYQQHAAEVWEAAAPVTMQGMGKLRIVSTPNGTGNEFHEAWERAVKDPAWAKHRVTLDMAIKQGMQIDINHCWQLAKGDPRLFAQLFRCSFLDNILQYLPLELIRACSTDEVLVKPVVFGSGVQYYAGLDIGREVDLSVLTVIRSANGVRDLCHVEVVKRTDNEALDEMVDAAFARYKIKRLCIDATGLGSFPAERIKKKHSERVDVAHRRPRVEPLDFTNSLKESLATNLYTALQDQTLRIPMTDGSLPRFERSATVNDQTLVRVVNEHGIAKQLRKELTSIKRIITEAGNVRFDTPRTSEGHGDRAWSLMLALHACDKVHPMVESLRIRMGLSKAGGAA